MKNIRLSNDKSLPRIGFGTYRSNEADSNIVLEALNAGYRYIDTASFYNNYKEIKMALKQSSVAREDIILSSKCWRTEMGYDKAIESYHRACEEIGVEKLDMFLIHWPRPNLTDPNWRDISKDTWRALEDLYISKKVDIIGVSNFYSVHLQNIMETANIKPMVNQIEYHPGFIQPEIVSLCQSMDIQVIGWSPLGCRRLLNNKILKDLSYKYSVSVAQICLKYSLQNGVIPLPKSSSYSRMIENLTLDDFTISDADMKMIDEMPLTGWSGEHPDHERVKFSEGR